MFDNMYHRIVTGTSAEEAQSMLEETVKEAESKLGIKLDVLEQRLCSVELYQSINPHVRLVAVAADYDSAVARIDRDFPGVIGDESLSQEVIVDAVWELSDSDAKRVGSKGPKVDYTQFDVRGYGATHEAAMESFNKDKDTAQKRFDANLDNEVGTTVTVCYFTKEGGARIMSKATDYDRAVQQVTEVFGDMSGLKSDVRIMTQYKLTEQEANHIANKPPSAGPGAGYSSCELSELVGDL
jgi:hypothetical protein